jgi:hypothetical protein
VRKKISAEFGHDLEKLLAHYIEQQKQHRDRLLRPATARPADDPDRPAADR